MIADAAVAGGLPAVLLVTAAFGALARTASIVVRGRRERLALSTYERCRRDEADAATDIAKIVASFHGAKPAAPDGSVPGRRRRRPRGRGPAD